MLTQITPLEVPVGQSGRQETGKQALGIDAVNEFDHLFEDVYNLSLIHI